MRRLLVLLGILFLAAGAQGANLLTNPSFEVGYLGDVTGWTVSPTNVGSEAWAARTGTNGLAFKGWEPGLAYPAYAYQEVAATPGTYTFAVRALKEGAFNPQVTELRLDWLDAGGATVQVATVADWISVPKDTNFHQIYVTGSCSSSTLAKVRATAYQVWTQSAGSCSFMIDDADLYEGTYAGSRLDGGSFEVGGSWRSAQWHGTRDLYGYGDGGKLAESWANHSGTSGVAFYSFVTNVPSSNFSIRIWQNVNPIQGTGAYTFALWLCQETNTFFSNAVMKIEWYDATFTNKVQDDSASNLVVPVDWIWHEYALEGVCTSPSLYEARVVFSADWSTQPYDAPGRATKLDDARFLTGPYTPDSLNTDWIYHGARGYEARWEDVPGTNGFGPFLQLNYVTHTNTFYFLTDADPLAKYPEEDAKVELRTAWQVPYTDIWEEVYTPMEKVATVDLTAANPFHGLPVAGTQQVAVWRCYWEQPRNPTNDVFYSNEAITVYYAPFIKVTNGIIETDYKYVVKQSDSTTVTNNLGQLLGDTYVGVDYAISSYKPPTWAVFTNGGFEDPLDVTNWLNDTGWSGSGRVNRELWANKAGKWGAAFTSWDPGESVLFQDVATTGGTHIFTAWAQVEPSATNFYYLNMKMEWYAKDGTLVQVNRQDLQDLPRRYVWNQVFVVGSCSHTNLDYVRLLMEGANGDTDTGGESVKWDDATFSPHEVGLTNAGFEVGIWQDTPGWYKMPSYLMEIHEWALRSGSNGIAFHGWEEDIPAYEAAMVQPVAGVITGTYVYSMWIRREADFALTNAELRLEWYGDDYDNKVQADTVKTISPPNDNTWAYYAITGTCENTDLCFVQPVLFAQWDRNIGAASRAMFVDDTGLDYTNLAPDFIDGIPVAWWDRYSIPGAQRIATNNPDSDFAWAGPEPVEADNLYEYITDTDPTSDSSVFSNSILVANGFGILSLPAGPPTTNSRLYDVWWKSNLMEAADWVLYGLDVPGDDNGDAVTLTVTNEVGARFYRTGVRLP